MLRVGRQPGVADALDLLVCFQHLGERHRGGAVAIHAQRQRHQPPQAQPRLERVHRPAGVDRDVPQALPPLRARAHDAPDQVVMAAEVLGGRVDHVLEPEPCRGAQIRRRERVVDRRRHARVTAERPQCLEIGHGHVGVGDRLHVEERRAGQCRAHRLQVVRVDEIDLHAELRQHPGGDRVGPAVELVREHQARARLGVSHDHRVDRRHPGGEPERRLRALQRRHLRLEGLHGRDSRSRVNRCSPPRGTRSSRRNPPRNRTGRSTSGRWGRWGSPDRRAACRRGRPGWRSPCPRSWDPAYPWSDQRSG